MEVALLIIGIITIIPVIFLLYERYIKQKHKVDIESGNVMFMRILSLVESRNNKLALLLFDLKIINSGTSNSTLKSLVLRYGDDKNTKEAKPYLLPTTQIKGKESIVCPCHVPPNSMDFIILMGDHIWKKICSINTLVPNGVVRGMAIFILDTPIDKVDEIKFLSLIVKDYDGNETEHQTEIKDNWKIDLGYQRPLLIDAPVVTGEKYPSWKGVQIESNARLKAVRLRKKVKA